MVKTLINNGIIIILGGAGLCPSTVSPENGWPCLAILPILPLLVAPSRPPPSMVPHFSSIFGGYFTHILGPKIRYFLSMWDPKAPDLAEGFYGLNSATSCAYTSRNQDRKHSGKHSTIMSIQDWSLKNLLKIFWTFGEGGDLLIRGWHDTWIYTSPYPFEPKCYDNSLEFYDRINTSNPTPEVPIGPNVAAVLSLTATSCVFFHFILVNIWSLHPTTPTCWICHCCLQLVNSIPT